MDFLTFGIDYMLTTAGGKTCSTTLTSGSASGSTLAFNGLFDRNTIQGSDQGGAEILMAYQTLGVRASVADQLQEGQAVTIDGSNYQINRILYLDDGWGASLIVSRAGVTQ